MKSRAKIILTNNARGKARWPDWFLTEVLKWMQKQIGTPLYRPTAELRVVVRNPSYKSRTRGLAILGFNEFDITHHRRAMRKNWRYLKYKYAKDYFVHSPVESVIFLLAHEMRHLTKENKVKERGFATEMDADRTAYSVVERWRKERAGLLRRWCGKHRRKLARKQAAKDKAKIRRVEESTTEAKIAKCEQAIAKWEAKKAKCDTHIAKYKRSMRALRAAQTRKAARS